MDCYVDRKLAVELGTLLQGCVVASDPIRLTDPVKFGDDFELDVRAYQLRRAGHPLKLERIPMELLVLLVEMRGQLVSREQIIERVWGKDVFIDSDNSINSAIRKIRQVLKDDPDQPRFVVTVTGKGYRFIAPVEEASPLLAQPVPVAQPVPAPVPPVPTKHWPVLSMAAGGFAVILLAISIPGIWKFRNKSPAVAQAHVRRSVAVLGFDNLSGRAEADWLSTGLSEALGTELAAGGTLRLIPGADVAQARKDLHISDAGALSKYNLSRLHKSLGADLVVFGSYLVLEDGRTRLDLRLQDAATGENVAVLAENGNEKKLLDLISAAGADMRRSLGVGTVAPVDLPGIQASLPASPEAARLYSEGLDKLRIFDFLEAHDLLLKASELDSSHAGTHSALAEAWRSLGYEARAQDEAQKAWDLSSGLSPDSRLWFEGQLHETRHEWDQAANAYHTLLQKYPDGLEYGLRLATVQGNAGKTREAIATIDLLRKLPSPAGDDPRLDTIAANMYGQMGDFKQELPLATRAVQSARAREANLVAARAVASQCEALRELGEFKESFAACEEAKRTFIEAGDRNHAAGALNSIALGLQAQGDYEGSKDKFLEALAIARKIGDKRSQARYLNNLALSLAAESDVRGALKMFDESLVIAREIGDKRSIINTLGNIGTNLNAIGDYRAARPKFEEAIALAHAGGSKVAEASNQIHVAELSVIQGDVPGARQALTAADSLLASTGDKRHPLYATFSWAEVLSISDDLPGARARLQEALNVSQQMGAKDLVAYAQMALANVSREQGRATDAVAMSQAAIDEFKAEKAIDFELQAYNALGCALLESGKPADADRALHSGLALLPHLTDPQMKIDVTTSVARTAAALGKAREALPRLHWAISEAHRLGALGEEFDARLALGEIEMKTGAANAGRAHLTQLHRDAQAKGYLLVARKADAALPSPLARLR